MDAGKEDKEFKDVKGHQRDTSAQNDQKSEKKEEMIKPSKKCQPVPYRENISERIHVKEEVEIYIKKKIHEDIDQVVKFISALMNTDGGVIRLNNKCHAKADPENFDSWFGRVEQKLFKTCSKFLSFCRGNSYSNQMDSFDKLPQQRCNTEKLLLKVKPRRDWICTIELYLYLPRVTDVLVVELTEVPSLLNNTDCSHSVHEFFQIIEPFEYGKVHPDAKEESDQVQFKEIKAKESDIPGKFSNMVNKYISAFCNHKGGRIFFGIEDKRSVVVGVPLTRDDKDSIKKIMSKKMEKDMVYGYEGSKTIYKEHWDIQFYEVKNPREGSIPLDGTLDVIVVTVSQFPGGVFTTAPVAYYVDRDGYIKQYNFSEWKDQIKKRFKDAKSDVTELKSDVTELKSEVSELKSNVKDVKQDFTEIKDKFPRINLLSITQGTDYDDGVFDSEDEVPSNVFDHHVVPDYLQTEDFYKLEEILKTENCVTIKGYLGTGKSTMALKVALSRKHKDTLVWKFDCCTTEVMFKSFAYLCKRLKCKVTNTGVNNEDILLMGRTVVNLLWEHTPNHVFIFDEVTQETNEVTKQLIETYLVSKSGVKTLITSTHKVTEKVLLVNGFTHKEAILFLSVEGSDEDKLKLLKFYSFNPLGLNIARKYIKECNISIKKFLRIINKETEGEIAVEDNAAIAGIKPLFKSVFCILRKICDSNPLVFKKMLLLRYFDSDEIPVILLQKAVYFLFSNEKKFDVLDVNDVLTTMGSYGFGTITGKDDSRVLHTYNIILEALKKFDKEISLDEVKASLMSVMCLMNKDNLMDFEKHCFLLPHAESILNHALMEKVTSKILMEDLWFSLPLLYVADIVGYTNDFKERHHDGAKYYKIAKECFMNLICGEFKEEDDPEGTAKNLYRKLISIVKEKKNILNEISKQFVLNKYRSDHDIQVLNSMLFEVQTIHGPYLREKDYDILSRRHRAVPEKSIGKYFFFEVIISFLYSYGRRDLYTPGQIEETNTRYCNVLLISYHLSKIFSLGESKFKILHQMLTNRNGRIPEALSRKLTLDQIEKLVTDCKTALEDDTTFFLYGTLYLDTKNDGHYKAAWLKQLVRCYKMMLSEVSMDDRERRESIISEGRSHANTLFHQIHSLNSSTAYPGLLLVVGEFYQCIEDLDSAKRHYREVANMQKEKNRKHFRLALIYILHCQLLESRMLVKTTTLDDVKDSISRCSRITLGYKNEQNKLEKILFDFTLEDNCLIQRQASIEYLKVRSSYLGNRALHIDREGLKNELFDLVKQFEVKTVGFHEEIAEIKGKLKAFRVEERN